MLRLQHVARAGEHERGRLVGDDHHRLEPPEIPVGAPVLGKLHGGAHELAGILLELRLEPLQQRKGVGGRAGEAGDHVALGELSDFAGVVLHHGLADADLPVAGHHDLAALAHGDDGRPVPGWELFGQRDTPAADEAGLEPERRLRPRSRCALFRSATSGAQIAGGAPTAAAPRSTFRSDAAARGAPAARRDRGGGERSHRPASSPAPASATSRCCRYWHRAARRCAHRRSAR